MKLILQDNLNKILIIDVVELKNSYPHAFVSRVLLEFTELQKQPNQWRMCIMNIFSRFIASKRAIVTKYVV